MDIEELLKRSSVASEQHALSEEDAVLLVRDLAVALRQLHEANSDGYYKAWRQVSEERDQLLAALRTRGELLQERQSDIERKTELILRLSEERDQLRAELQEAKSDFDSFAEHHRATEADYGKMRSELEEAETLLEECEEFIQEEHDHDPRPWSRNLLDTLRARKEGKQ